MASSFSDIGKMFKSSWNPVDRDFIAAPFESNNKLISPFAWFKNNNVPQPIPHTAATPEEASAQVMAARDAERNRRRAAASSTVLTTPLGVPSTPTTPAATGGKTLLGA